MLQISVMNPSNISWVLHENQFIFAFVKSFLKFKTPIAFASPITKPDWKRLLSDHLTYRHVP